MADINMQKDQVTTIGNNVTDLGTAVGQMHSYGAGDGLTVAHFGGVESASDAGTLFLSTVSALTDSVNKAANFCNQAGQTIAKSVAATSLVDEEAMWGLNKAGGGA
ncbi:MAG TPA: hypothetical protein VG247_36550 [Pseudonocardiaceae bacterium]|jgi:hypothetical protein|nr:hypothetical protein [Pseudonocardiaceae bacterium]